MGLSLNGGISPTQGIAALLPILPPPILPPPEPEDIVGLLYRFDAAIQGNFTLSSFDFERKPVTNWTNTAINAPPSSNLTTVGFTHFEEGRLNTLPGFKGNHLHDGTPTGTAAAVTGVGLSQPVTIFIALETGAELDGLRIVGVLPTPSTPTILHLQGGNFLSNFGSQLDFPKEEGPLIVGIRADGAASELFGKYMLSGNTFSVTGDLGTASISTLQISSDANENDPWRIFEFLMYDSALNATLSTSILTFLEQKWFTTSFPLQIRDLEAWWDFSDASTVTLNGSLVERIADKTGGQRDLVQSTMSLQPLYDTLSQNGLNAASFDGTGELLPLPLGLTSGLGFEFPFPYTIALNFQPDVPLTTGRIMDSPDPNGFAVPVFGDINFIDLASLGANSTELSITNNPPFGFDPLETEVVGPIVRQKAPDLLFRNDFLVSSTATFAAGNPVPTIDTGAITFNTTLGRNVWTGTFGQNLEYFEAGNLHVDPNVFYFRQLVCEKYS